MALLGCFGAVGLWLLSWQISDHARTLQVAALLTGAISLFASGVLPGYVTSLLVFFAAAAFDLTPASIAFSGFASGGVWLLLAGIVIGHAARETGLGTLIAARLTSSVRLTYGRAILLLVTTALLLGFVVPAAIPRIIILMPLVTGIAEMAGYRSGGRGYTGLAIAVAAGSFYAPTSILTATLPAIVFAGGIEASYGHAPSYLEFLLYHFPVTGLLRWGALLALLLVFFSEPMAPQPRAATHELRPDQRRLLIILAVTVCFWMTDAWHGISPAWVSLGAAIALLMPGTGVLSPAQFSKEADLTPVLYVAGIISLGAIVSNSALDDVIGSKIGSWYFLPGGYEFLAYLYVAMLSSLACLALTAPAAPALLVPLAQQLSDVTGLDLTATLMTAYLGMTNILLPYQAPPLIVSLALFGIAPASMVRVALLLFVATGIVILPLNFVWWSSLGLMR